MVPAVPEKGSFSRVSELYAWVTDRSPLIEPMDVPLSHTWPTPLLDSLSKTSAQYQVLGVSRLVELYRSYRVRAPFQKNTSRPSREASKVTSHTLLPLA